MKKHLLKTIFTFCALLSIESSFAQTQIIWTDTFNIGVPATAPQIANWNAFRALLVTHPYTKVIMKGTFDQTGQSCTDTSIVHSLATSLLNNTDYISPSACNGHVWHNCATHGYQGEVWLDPPSACSGANCPGPNGYIIRPGIGTSNPNWGGVNSNTCNGANQRMTLIFEYGTSTGVLGINVADAEFSVYPNPFGNSFNVSVKNINTSELTVVNVVGAIVYKQQVSSGTTTIDTEKLKAGIYFVSVKTENGILTKKIIKE